MWGAVAAALLAPALAWAAPSYPPSLDREAILAWVTQATDLKPEQVIGANSGTLFALLPQKPIGGFPTVLLRAEALTPEAAARSRVLSAQARVQVDCARELVKMGPMSGYATRTPRGAPTALGGGDADWRVPGQGTPVQGVLHVVCRDVASSAAAAPREAPQRPPAPQVAGSLAGPVAAQVVSSASQPAASAALARVKARFAADLGAMGTRIEPAQVAGRTVYRGLVVGFAGRGPAEAFCRTLKGQGQDCFVR